MNLEEQVKAFEQRPLQAFKRQKITGLPNPRKRRCSSCDLYVEVTDDWRCPTPGCTIRGKQTPMEYSLTSSECQHGCGRTVRAQYVGNQVRPLGRCLCQESVEEEKARREKEEEQEIARRKTEQHIQFARTSHHCFSVEHRGQCQLPKDTFDYCYTCTRFKDGLHYQNLRRARDRE